MNPLLLHDAAEAAAVAPEPPRNQAIPPPAPRLEEAAPLLERAAAARDRRTAASLLARAARVHEACGEPARARALAERALAFFPGEPDALAIALRGWREAGDAARAAEALRAARREAPDDARVAALAAPLLEQERDWPALDAALVVRLRAERGAARRETLRQLVRCREIAGEPASLAEALEALAPELTETPREELAARARLAELLERLGGRAAEVEAQLRRVLELDPEHAAALARLGGLARAAGRSEEAAALIERRLARAEGAGRSELLRELAALKGAAGDAAGRLALLEALPEGERDPRARLECLEALARGAEAPEDRARWELRAARLCEEELRQDGLAFAATVRAVRAAPALAEARELLARLADRAGAQAERARVLAEVAAAAEGEAALDAWRELARARAGLGDEAGAIAAWEAVRSRAPRDPEALGALAEAYERGGDGTRLAEVLAARRAAGVRDPATAWRLAELLAGTLRRPLEAVALFEEVLAAERHPGAAAWIVALAARPDAAGRRAAAAAERVADGLEPAARARAWERIARGSSREGAWRRCARAWEAAGERVRARDAWRAVRARHPDDAEALARLDALLGKDAPAAERADVAWARLPALPPAWRRRGVARAAALSQRAGQWLRALDGWAELLAAGAPDPAVVAAVERLQERAECGPAAERVLEALWRRTGEARRLAALLARRAAREDGPAAAALLRELAVLHERLGDADAAAARWAEAVEREASPEALLALARAEARRGGWREHAAALERRAERLPAGHARTQAFIEVAKTMEARLNDREAALVAWRRALAEDPENAEALRELARLLGDAERWGELADVLARQAAVTERRSNRAMESADLRVRAGRIRHERLGDAAGALQLFRGALERAPSHPETIEALRALAREGSREAALLLEPLAERGGDAALAAEILALRAASAPPPERAAIRLRLAGLEESRGDRAAAFAAAAQALRDDPDSPAALEASERLAPADDGGAALRALLGDVVKRARAERSRTALWRRLAAGAPDDAAAEDAWSALLELDPADRGALAGLAAAQRRRGNAAGLAETLRRQLVLAADADERAALLAELATAEERRGDLAGAAQALSERIALVPGDAACRAHLGRVLEAAGRWPELAELLARELAEAPGGEAATALRFRLAELRASRLDDPAGALALLEEVIAAEPSHEGALARLEAWFEERPGEVRVAAALARACEAAREWERLCAVLEAHAAERPEPAERAALLARAGELRERRLAQPEMAFVTLCRAWRDGPEDARLRGELARLAAATGQEEELAAVLEEAAERLPAGPAAEVLVELGALHGGALGDPARAVDCWARAHRLDPERAAPILARLERLAEECGRHAEQAEAIEARAATLEGGGRAAQLDRAARLHAERLGRPERALALWRVAAEADPSCLPALRALAADALTRGDPEPSLGLAGALVRAGQGGEAAETVRRLLEAEVLGPAALDRAEAICASAGAAPERARLAERRAAALQASGNGAEAAAAWDRAADRREEAGDLEGAAAAVEKAHALEPGEAQRFTRLRALHARRGAWRDDARACLDAAERAEAPEQRAALLADAARIQEHRLGEADFAFFSWCRVLQLRPGDAEAADGAERLAASGGWDELAAVWEGIAESASGAARAQALLRVARLRRERLDDAAGARAATLAAFEADPATPATREAALALLEREGRWTDLAALLAAARAAAATRDESAALLRRLAVVLEEQLGDHAAALDAWQQARALTPEDPAALDAVERLAALLERWDALDAVYEARAARAADARGRAAWLRRSAALREERQDDVEGATARIEEALALDPSDAPSWGRLARLHARAGRDEDRARALDRQAEAATDARERLVARMQAAPAWLACGRTPAAEAAWREALRLEPRAEEALLGLAALLERGGERAGALEVLQRLADVQDGTAAAAGTWARIARVRQARGEHADAERAWRRALELDPEELESLRALRARAEAAGDVREQVALLGREARAARSGAERAAALWSCGRLQQEKLLDEDGAARSFAEAVEADAGHLEAARALADLRLARGEWSEAATLLQGVVERLPAGGDRRDAARVWYRLGLARERGGEAARALECQRKARELDPRWEPALERIAALAEEGGAVEEAIVAREALLDAAGEGTPREERAAALLALARLEERVGRPARAAARLVRALELDPALGAARERLAAVLEAQGDHRAALPHRRRLAEAATGPARAAAWAAIGALCRDRLDDAPAAVEAFQAAAVSDPADLTVADALVGLLLRTGQPQRAADALARTVTACAPRDPSRAARLQLARARLLRDRVRDPAGAAEAYGAALELDPSLVQCLAELEGVLAAGRRWRDLEAAYQRMLERLPRDPATRRARATLWRALAALYANALADPEAARTAERVADSIEAGAPAPARG